MTCFADQALSQTVSTLENETIAKDTKRIRLSAPEFAERVVPGQFFMVRDPSSDDPLIGRALAIYDVDREAGWIDLVYLVKGKLTTRMAEFSAGDPVGLWGPLGNGFTPRRTGHLVMVAGGIGQTPFLTLAREALGKQTFGDGAARMSSYADHVHFCYGVRNADYLAGVNQFEEAGCKVHIATEDGSLGPAQRVTNALEALIHDLRGEEIQIVCCGPEPMMEAVARIASAHELPCQVSLETPMACGIGICFSCVARIGTADDWDYKRTCVEGPVFEADQVVW